jgi:hypothetical protein
MPSILNAIDQTPPSCTVSFWHSFFSGVSSGEVFAGKTRGERSQKRMEVSELLDARTFVCGQGALVLWRALEAVEAAGLVNSG